MRTKLATGIALALLFAPATLLAQEGEQQCDLQATPQTQLAQQMLNQARDTTRAASERQSAYKQAWEAVKGPVSDETEDPTPYVLGAQALVGMEQYAQADSVLTAFEKIASKPCMKLARQVRRQAWAQLYNKAIESFNQGDRDAALENFEQANSIFDDARSLVNAATLHNQRGNTERAMELYSRALETGGSEANMRDALRNLARTRMSQGDTAAAMRQYERYLGQNPDDVSVLASYAQALNQAGRSDSAQAIFGDLVGRTGLTFEQWSQIGVGLYQAGSYSQAITAFTKARAERPLNKETMENLLSAYAQAERWEEIPSLADTVTSWFPYDAKNYRPAVRAYDNMKQPDRAQGLLNEIRDLPIQMAQLGMTEAGQGTYVVQGQFQVTSQSAAGKEITIPFEFLDGSGNVVATKEFTTTLPEEGGTKTVKFRVEAGQQLAAFRYSKDQSLGGSSSSSEAGGR